MDGWLGIDMGGTATRWVWLGADGVMQRGEAPGASAMIHDPKLRAGFAAALADVAAALPGRVRAAHLGLTGARFTRAPEVTTLAATALELAPDRLSHENDVELAHRAVFPDGCGHLVLAGTGAVGIGATARGRAVVGGRGALLDDRGGAVWIVLEALRAVYARHDAIGSFHGAEALAEALGAADWDATRARVYGDRGALGLMAPEVARLAAAGCPVAGDVLGRAAAELLAMAEQLESRLGAAPLAFIGGVLRLPGVAENLRAGHPEARFPVPDAARAAAEQARRTHP